MRQRCQWGRFPVSNVVKSLGLMWGWGWGWRRLLQGAAGGGGAGGAALPGDWQGAGGFYRCFTSFFFPLKPCQLPAPHHTCESHQFFPPPFPWKGPRPPTCAPLQLRHTVKSSGERVRSLGDPLLPYGGTQLGTSFPSPPPPFSYPLFSVRRHAPCHPGGQRGGGHVFGMGGLAV